MAKKGDSCDGKCDCDKEIRIYFCPGCKSNNVRYTFGIGNLFGIIPKMKCSDCGFEAAGFPLIVTSKNKIEKAVASMKKRRSRKKVFKKIKNKSTREK